jgi:hypothetical protein
MFPGLLSFREGRLSAVGDRVKLPSVYTSLCWSIRNWFTYALGLAR